MGRIQLITGCGVDFNYHSELPGLTRLPNKLPNYESKTVSNINTYGEAALMDPGHPSQIGKGNNGLYILTILKAQQAVLIFGFHL